MTSDEDRPVGPSGSEPVGDYVRIYRRGRVWHANYQVRGKQHRVSLKTSNKKAAQRKALRIDTELAAGQWRPPVKTESVESAVAAYLDSVRVDDAALTTLRKYTGVLKRVIALANERKVRDLVGINFAFVDAYLRMRTEAGVSTETRHDDLVTIRQMVNFALSRRMIESDPLAGLRLKKPKPAIQPCWTESEVTKILAACPPEIRPALVILAETGLRFGELAWLTWDDVDLNDRVLWVRPKAGWRLKTGNQRRVPLSESARSVLADLPRRWRWVVTMPPSQASPDPGRQWTERRLLAALKLVLKRLGLPGKIHTFRHFFISNALLKGTPEVVVRKWAGHVDQRIIDMYSHVHDEADQAAMQRLGESNRKLQQLKEV